MTVAGSRPYDALSLLDEPLWRILWTFHHLMEREQRTQLSDRLMRVDAAGLTAQAFHDPKLLADEMRTVQQAIRDHEEGPVVTESVRDRGLALVERIRRGNALAPEALLS